MVSLSNSNRLPINSAVMVVKPARGHLGSGMNLDLLMPSCFAFFFQIQSTAPGEAVVESLSWNCAGGFFCSLSWRRTFGSNRRRVRALRRCALFFSLRSPQKDAFEL